MLTSTTAGLSSESFAARVCQVIFTMMLINFQGLLESSTPFFICHTGPKRYRLDSIRVLTSALMEFVPRVVVVWVHCTKIAEEHRRARESEARFRNGAEPREQMPGPSRSFRNFSRGSSRERRRSREWSRESSRSQSRHAARKSRRSRKKGKQRRKPSISPSEMSSPSSDPSEEDSKFGQSDHQLDLGDTINRTSD